MKSNYCFYLLATLMSMIATVSSDVYGYYHCKKYTHLQYFNCNSEFVFYTCYSRKSVSIVYYWPTLNSCI